jgi:alpha-galactosidase
MAKKLILIGAGSAMFTQGLVMDMLSESWDEPWELGLCDIDPAALDAMTKLTKKMIAEKKGNITLLSSTERKELLPGADFVVSTIGVGGRRAWEQDVFIPRNYGVFQPVGDSVAPGGISRAMRMIPTLVGVANDIKELCPGAHFFNYANPMTSIVTAVRRATGVPVVGLCHGVAHGLRKLAEFAGLDEDKMSGHVVGLNHFVVIYKLYEDGKDAWPAVKAAIDKNTAAPLGPLSTEFIRLYGAYPASDDRPYSEVTQSYFGEGAYFGKTLGVDAYSFEGTIEEGDQIYDETVALANADGPLPATFWQKLDGEHEQLMAIIQSILHDKRENYIINVPNGVSVAGMPSGAVLEMPATATAHGFVSSVITDFPGKFTGMLSKHAGIADLTVEAALTGNRALFEEAIWQGGYMKSRSDVASMVGKLIEAQKEYLPQF